MYYDQNSKEILVEPSLEAICRKSNDSIYFCWLPSFYSQECLNDPPTVLSGALSDWTGLAPFAGSVITYTCSSDPNHQQYIR